jgi:dTDP-4-dehydrorhamnose 3,5-epimerase
VSETRLQTDDILEEFAGPAKSYKPKVQLSGVEVLRLRRHVDDRGYFMELYRNGATHPGSEELARFFEGVEVAQLNYSIVDRTSTVKGLHYHLGQMDIWFCPPESKMKIVLWDLRQGSPTSNEVQVAVAGGGQEVLVKIPPGVAHGYRPLSAPCALFYIVTRPFDVEDPDEYRVAWDHPTVRDLWEVENS